MIRQRLQGSETAGHAGAPNIPSPKGPSVAAGLKNVGTRRRRALTPLPTPDPCQRLAESLPPRGCSDFVVPDPCIPLHPERREARDGRVLHGPGFARRETRRNPDRAPGHARPTASSPWITRSKAPLRLQRSVSDARDDSTAHRTSHAAREARRHPFPERSTRL